MCGYDVATQAELDAAAKNPRVLGLEALKAIAHNRATIAQNSSAWHQAGLHPQAFLVFLTGDFTRFTYRDGEGKWQEDSSVDDLSAIARLNQQLEAAHQRMGTVDTLVVVELPEASAA
jgi:hypothetical protein